MRISVVIPAFNCAAYLPEAIRSVLQQTHPAHEIIVVDDGSTDGTADAIREFADRIIYLRTEQLGVSCARNTGLARATGDWVSFLDADDAWYPEKLQVQSLVVGRCPRSVLVCSDFGLVDERGKPGAERYIKTKYPIFRSNRVGWTEIFEFRESLPGHVTDVYHGDAFRWLFRGNFVNTSSVLARADQVREAGGFAAGRQTQEDYELWLKLAMRGSLAYVDKPLLFFRLRPFQLTAPSQGLRIARDTLDVVSELAPAARRKCHPRIVRRRVAELYSRLAVAHLGAESRDLARQCVNQAVVEYGLTPRLAALWAWTWIPTSAAGRALRVYRSLRVRRRPANAF